MARRRRPVAEPDLPVAQRRLGLRRLRLPRRAPRARDARGPRRARGARRRARDPGAARPRPQPHERPAPVVPRAPRLLRLARGPQRRAAQQLEEQLRRPGVDARRGQRPVVPAQLHARAARPRLVERGRARRVRRHPALLDGPRDRRLPHRRRPRDRQGPRAARQPARDRGRHRAPPLAGPAARVLDEPRRGPRRLPPLARGVRPATAACSLGETWVLDLERLMRFYGDGPRRAAPGLQLRLPARRLRGGAARADRGRDRGADARARLAGVDARQPRHGALPDALDARRPRRSRAARSCCC